MANRNIKRQKIDTLEDFHSAYYANNLNNAKIVRYLKDENKPYNKLLKKIEQSESQRSNIKPREFVGHLFARDLRLNDNRGLFLANELARSHEMALICFFVYCKEEFDSHNVSPLQLNYRLIALQQLQAELENMNIPLAILQVDKKKNIASTILKTLNQYQVSHLFSNMEYEVDELRLFDRLLDLLLENNISFQPVQDSCVVTPGLLKTKSKGTQYSVFTPWFKSWCSFLKDQENPFPDYSKISENSAKIKFRCKDLFGNTIPNVKSELSEEQANSLKECPIGEKEAVQKFVEYMKSDKIKKYDDTRNDIAFNSVSHMSVHLASGTISARTIIRIIIQNKLVSSVNTGDKGALSYIRQIAWRDFYKHILCNWPHVCMYRPFQIEYIDLKWEYNKEHFERWCQGRTGYPIVDASMRMLCETGYIHNRCRMIVASFLSKNLLIDWRYGERFFMENLIDGDFASNNGGWGFSSSVGVDPQPYFRIFNAWTQSEKFDKNGDFIRRWLPELREIDDNKAIHNPYAFGFEKLAEKNMYPRPIVDHKETRERALERYKEAKY